MHSRVQYFLAAVLFVVAIVVTEPIFWADSADYVDSIVAFQHNNYYQFVEFGHLLWRPVGWLVWQGFFSGDDPAMWRVEIFRALRSINILAGFGSTLLLLAIFRQIKIGPLYAIICCIAFVSTHAFLNFSQTGSPYVAGLFFYLAGLYFALTGGDTKRTSYALYSGVCLGVALCFWIAFLWVVPAALLAPVIIFQKDRLSLRLFFWRGLAFAAAVGIFYLGALISIGIGTFSEFQAWVAMAAHGNETRGVLRAIFGMARSFIYLGNDGIQFKRYLLNDPYNPVSIFSLINGTLLKFAVFYSLAGVVLIVGIQRDLRKWLVFLLVSAAPLLLFAMFYDGGAVERYLPLFPAAFIFLAIALDNISTRSLRWLLVAAIVTFAVLNLGGLSRWESAAREAITASRMDVLLTRLKPNDRTFLVNWTDDLVNFARSFPFNPVNANADLKFRVVVTQGSSHSVTWREEFSKRALMTWDEGGNVWLSARAFSERPELEWNWAEGDDKNVMWQDFPAFFSRVEVGERLGGGDGFVLVPASEVNRRMFTAYAAKYVGPPPEVDKDR